MRRRVTTGLGLVVVVLLLAACGRLNRTATLNQITSGPAAALVLQHQLAHQGHPGAQVHCRRTLLVNVGITSSCALTSAGVYHSVRFTFSSDSGKIKLSSVRAQ